MPLFIVETIQTFRHRYVVECKELEHAYDTVAMGDAEEFSQMYLGENIISGRKISKKKFRKMNDALNHHGDGTSSQPESGSPWLGEKVIYKVEYPEDKDGI